MTSFVPAEPTAEIAERIASLMPDGETDWAERGRSMARSMLLLQANKLEGIAATDDLSLYRQAKEDDAAYNAFRTYFIEHQPLMVAGADCGGNSIAMRTYLRGDICERREMLLGSALLLRQLATQPMDQETLAAAEACLSLLPAVVRL